MSTVSKRTYWQAHIDQWSKSDVSQKAYCQANDLSVATFGYWRKKLSTKKPSSNLIPMTVSAPTTVRVRLAWGAELEVPISALEAVLPILARSANGLE